MERFSFASDVAFVPRGDLLDGGPATRPRRSSTSRGGGVGGDPNGVVVSGPPRVVVSNPAVAEYGRHRSLPLTVARHER